MNDFMTRIMFVLLCGIAIFVLILLPSQVFADESETPKDEAVSEETSNDLTLFYSGSNKMQYTDDKISGKTKFENEFVLNLGYSDYSAYFRVSNDLSFPNASKDYEIEKSTLRWYGTDLTVTAGDFSATFAKGLALNAFESPEVDFDTELRGGMVSAEFDWVTLTALYGLNEANDYSQNDRVTGFRSEFHIGEDANIAGTYVEVEDFQGALQGYWDTKITGVDGSVDVGPVTVGAEYVRYDRDENDPIDDGNGIIGWLSYSGNDWSIYGGMYEYNRIGSPYAVPASFKEHPEKAVSDPWDEKGYGARFTWSPKDWGSIDLNYAQSNRSLRGLPYTEALFTWTLPPTSQNSFIIENRYVYEIIGKENATIIEWQRILNDEWTSSVTAQHVYVEDTFGVHKEHLLALGVDYDHQFSATYEYEHAAFRIPLQNRWDKITLRYNDPSSVFDVQLAYGSQREGFKCSGGACQLLPAFKGVELTVNFYF